MGSNLLSMHLKECLFAERVHLPRRRIIQVEEFFLVVEPNHKDLTEFSTPDFELNPCGCSFIARCQFLVSLLSSH